MDAYRIALVIAGAGVLGVVVWVLATLGRALVKLAEALAAAAVVLVAVWLVIKAVGWALRQTVTHWRTSLTVLALMAWWHWWGSTSLVVTAGVVASVLTGWRLVDVASFDAWAGRHLRSWWLRWTVYASKLPEWLHACGLSIKPDAAPVMVVSPLGRSIRRGRSQPRAHLPQVLGVRSGASWDEVRIHLVPGQKPEDFDAAARALASARAVARCQVRELSPNVVSVDFQRRNLLADPVPCLDLVTLATVAGAEVDLRRVFSGRTEYGQDWHVPLRGWSHPGGRGQWGGQELRDVVPAGVDRPRDPRRPGAGLRDRSQGDGIGLRAADLYPLRRHRHRRLAVLDDLVQQMHARKATFAGRVRVAPISTEHPLELLEFDEIGALTKYIDRRTRDAITERVALLTTQGRALGFTVRGYVQEPTKDTVPVRELFPRRICLRVSAKSHVGMVLGDQAYERGAWANRITETEAGTGYVFGEGIREPLRVRAGWVPDATIKQLETFVTGPINHNTTVLPFPTTPTDPTGSTRGGAA